MAITLAHRFGSVMPFARFHSREDDRYGGVQVGLTSYHETKSGDEEYRTSYYEVGARADHLSVPVASAMNIDMAPLMTDSVSSEDTDYVRSKPEPKVAPLTVAA